MIKLFEPFKSKLQLHIRQDFLQELWDKYVPVSSEAYDRISLIYLKGGAEQTDTNSRQVRVLVEFILKNISMQISMRGNPLLVTQNAVGNSLLSVRKYYLTQLKSSNLQAFREINQYIAYLNQAEEENRRYERWKRDYRAAVELERDYQVLHRFSERLKELSYVQMPNIEREQIYKLFGLMEEREYKILSEFIIRQEKQRIEKAVRSCSKEEYRQLLKQIESESLPEVQDGLKQESHLAEICHAVKERFIQETGKSWTENELPEERLIQWAENVFPSGRVWSTNKEVLFYRLDRLDVRKMDHFYGYLCELAGKLSDGKQMDEILSAVKEELLRDRVIQESEEWIFSDIFQRFSANLEEMQVRYLSEIRRHIQTVLLDAENGEESEILMREVNLKPLLKSGGTGRFHEDAKLTHWINSAKKSVIELKQENTGEQNILDMQRSRLEQEVFDTQKILYEKGIANEQGLWSGQNAVNRLEVLSEIQAFTDAVRQVSQTVERRLQEQKGLVIEKEFQSLNHYRDILHMEEALSDIFLQKEETGGLFFRGNVKELLRHKYQEISLTDREVRKLQEWGRALFLNGEYVTKEDAEAFWNTKNHTIQNVGEEPEYLAEFRKLTEEINAGEQSENVHVKYRETVFTDQTIQELLSYVWQMDESQHQVFVKILSDIIRMERQTFHNFVKRAFLENDAVRRETADVKQAESELLESEGFEGKLVRKDSIQRDLVQRDLIQRESIQSDSIQRELFQRESNQKDFIQTDPAQTGQIQSEPHELPQAEPSKEENAGLEPQGEGVFPDVEKIFCMDYGSQMAKEDIRELKNWSEELIKSQDMRYLEERIGSVSEEKQAESDFLPENIQNMQTEIIRRHIQRAKDRSELERLIEQVEHYTKEEVKLTYREEALASPDIRKLVRHIQELSGEQYHIFIRQISEMLRLCQRGISGENREAGLTEWIEQTKQIKQINQVQEPESSEQAERMEPPEHLGESGRQLVYKEEYYSASQVLGHQVQAQQVKGGIFPHQTVEDTALPDGSIQQQKKAEEQEKQQSQTAWQQTLEQQGKQDYTKRQRMLEHREYREQAAQQRMPEHREYREQPVQQQILKRMEVQNQTLQQAEGYLRFAAGQRIYEIYPKLSQYIQEYEILRRKEYQAKFRRFQEGKLSTSMLSASIRQGLSEFVRAELKKIDAAEEYHILHPKTEYQKTAYPDTEHRNAGHRESEYRTIDYPDTEYQETDYPKGVYRNAVYQESEHRRIGDGNTEYQKAVNPIRNYRNAEYTEQDSRGLDYPNTEYYEPDSRRFDYRDTGHQNGGHQRMEYTDTAYRRYEPFRELKHAEPKGIRQGRRQEQDLRMQEDQSRMKSAQEQMEVRLKQMEQQLKQVEIRTTSEEDVRSAAEKIKRLLYEELHIEKLRRGLT